MDRPYQESLLRLCKLENMIGLVIEADHYDIDPEIFDGFLQPLLDQKERELKFFKANREQWLEKLKEE